MNSCRAGWGSHPGCQWLMSVSRMEYQGFNRVPAQAAVSREGSWQYGRRRAMSPRPIRGSQSRITTSAGRSLVNVIGRYSSSR